MRGSNHLGLLLATGIAGVAAAGVSANEPNRLDTAPPQQATRSPYSDDGFSLRDQARAVLESADNAGCRLEPLRDAFLSDDARFVVHFRLPQDEVRAIEMSGAEHKAFAVDLAQELGFTKLTCVNIGRFYHLDGTTVHVREQRLLDAVYKGEDVALELTWDMLISPAGGDAIQVRDLNGYLEAR